jgi:hypothetical protein
MGKTYKKYSNRYDDEFPSGRSGKHAKHTNGKKTGGMRTINNYVEENYEFEDSEPFDDAIELQDEIEVQHTTQTK